jgi:hypothetical protein
VETNARDRTPASPLASDWASGRRHRPGEQPSHFRQQILAHWRQLDGTLRTYKQRHAEHVFQRPDGLRQRRLGHREAPCSSSEVHFFRNRHKIPQQSEFDVPRFH